MKEHLSKLTRRNFLINHFSSALTGGGLAAMLVGTGQRFRVESFILDEFTRAKRVLETPCLQLEPEKQKACLDLTDPAIDKYNQDRKLNMLNFYGGDKAAVLAETGKYFLLTGLIVKWIDHLAQRTKHQSV